MKRNNKVNKNEPQLITIGRGCARTGWLLHHLADMSNEDQMITQKLMNNEMKGKGAING